MRAFVFPGQGSQYSGMGKDLAEAFPEAREVFAEADEALGFPISRLCFEGSEEQLKLTEHTQPAILTVSVAALRVLHSRGQVPDYVAGHSLGEYSALVAARSLAFGDAVRIVRQRGRFMQEAVPVGIGAMAAVIGLDPEVLGSICLEAAQGQVVSPANINAPGQLVIAGHTEAVERAGKLATERGARKVVRLPVSAPFHCSLMKPAEERLAEALTPIRFSDLEIPLVNNVDARLVRTGREAREGLIRQVSSAVRWVDDVEQLVRQGVDCFVEVGPGKVLSGLIRRIARDAGVTPAGTVEEVKAYV
ncbi:MAG: [acyl-carrier-protein] S-malonyltransferase [Acidobacteria bacterium]|nr:MAG: [acyl-carrier-protein] S-malonyltransferase [Acidobacteriota bacterium]